MFGRESESGLPKGRGGRGRRSYFFKDWLLRGATTDRGTSKSLPQQMWETVADLGSSESSFELELSSEDDIMWEVEDNAETSMAEIIIRPQGVGSDPPLATHPTCTRSTSGSRYVRDWVS